MHSLKDLFNARQKRLKDVREVGKHGFMQICSNLLFRG